jgi:hypothetical protein
MHIFGAALLYVRLPLPCDISHRQVRFRWP